MGVDQEMWKYRIGTFSGLGICKRQRIMKPSQGIDFDNIFIPIMTIMALLITLHCGQQTNGLNTSTTYLHGSMYNNNIPDVVTWFKDYSIPKESLSEGVGYNTAPVNATLDCQPTTITLPTLPADLVVSSYIKCTS